MRVSEVSDSPTSGSCACCKSHPFGSIIHLFGTASPNRCVCSASESIAAISKRFYVSFANPPISIRINTLQQAYIRKRKPETIRSPCADCSFRYIMFEMGASGIAYDARQNSAHKAPNRTAIARFPEGPSA